MQLSIFNEEFLVGASHQLAPTVSLPFVHTARRSYRSNGRAKPSEGRRLPGTGPRDVRPDRPERARRGPGAGDGEGRLEASSVEVG